jgi:GNAT superfamily N-acetyltransferase
MEVRTVESRDALPWSGAGDTVEALTPAEFERDAPDAHVIVTDRGRLIARCSLWWRNAPPLAHHRVGLIGHYAAGSAVAGRALVRQACRRLAAERCTTAIGPVDGSTWRRYRFVTTRGAEQPFFLEPENADRWPDDFVRAGFSTLAAYRSGVTDDLAGEAERADETARRLTFFGISVRTFDSLRAGEELARLHSVSVRSFKDNLLFMPIAAGDFCRLYSPVAALTSPELVLIAEVDGQPVGFVFAVPNLLERAGTVARTVIVKTLAVLPEWRHMGIGRVLFARVHASATALGYRRAIHALMHDGNVSRAMSERSARAFRHYALFARAL